MWSFTVKYDFYSQKSIHLPITKSFAILQWILINILESIVILEFQKLKFEIQAHGGEIHVTLNKQGDLSQSNYFLKDTGKE